MVFFCDFFPDKSNRELKTEYIYLKNVDKEIELLLI